MSESSENSVEDIEGVISVLELLKNKIYNNIIALIILSFIAFIGYQWGKLTFDYPILGLSLALLSVLLVASFKVYHGKKEVTPFSETTINSKQLGELTDKYYATSKEFNSKLYLRYVYALFSLVIINFVALLSVIYGISIMPIWASTMKPVVGLAIINALGMLCLVGADIYLIVALDNALGRDIWLFGKYKEWLEEQEEQENN